MRAFIVRNLLSLALRLGLLGVGLTSMAAEPPPSPEAFLAPGRAADFLPLAKDFLKANPQHERAWQTAWDLYQMARIAGEFKEARDARLRLVVDYAESLPARHLLAQMTAGEYASVLKECFRHLDVDDQPAGLERIVRGTDLGFKQYGVDLGGDALLLQLALATGGKRWAELIPRLKNRDAQTVQIAIIAFDQDLSPKEKILRLQEVGDNDTAKGYQRLLYAQLPAEERDSIDIAAILAKDLLEEEENFQAARLLARVCPKLGTREILPEEYPELLFGWAHAEAAQGHGKAAAEILKRLVKEAPSIPGDEMRPKFVEPSTKLIPIFENLDANFAEQENVVGEVAEAWQTASPELLEFKLQGNEAKTDDFLAWMRLDLKHEAVEIMAEYKGKVIFAFQTSAESSRVFLLNHPRIRQYAKRAGYPYLEYDIKNLPDGTGRFSFGMGLSERGQGRLRHSVESMLAAKQLLQPDSRRGLVRFAMASGIFPAGVKTENGQRVVTWVAVSPSKPELQFVDFDISPDNRITSVAIEGAKLQIYSGPSGQSQLVLPALPSVPVENLSEMKMEDFFRIYGEAAELAGKLIAQSQAEVEDENDKNQK
jgi:hypothetical protein